MKLLVLNYEYPPIGGGASPVSKLITEKLAEKVDHIDVVTMHYRGLPRVEKRRNVTVHRVRCLRKERQSSRMFEFILFIVFGYFYVKKRLSPHEYDLIHCHFIVPTGLLASIIKKKLRIPYVITAHGSDVPGHNPEKFGLYHKILLPVTRRIAERAAALVFPSKYLMERSCEVLGARERSRHIPNGIEAERFNPKDKRKSILSVGRLISLKGFDTLISAVENSDIGYTVHIVGDGPLKAHLQERARMSKTRVIVHGWLDNTSSEFNELIETASIFCLLSRVENASIALLEAMAAGCAVLTTNNPGAAETLSDAGDYIDFGDYAELHKKLRYLTQNEDVLDSMCEKSRERFERFFTIDATVDKYYSLFSEMKGV